MAITDNGGVTGTGPRTQQTFSFHAANGRIYAANVDRKLIDLGRLERDGAGWGWRLDGNGLQGGGCPSVEAALQDVAAQAGFLYLDGQFTALADLREQEGPDLAQAVSVEVTMDELQPGERMQDART